MFQDYIPEASAKRTVGIPLALFTYGMFSLFNAFFKELGFNVLLSDPTSEKTVALGQQYALDETFH
ncbi:acyl-CoA dehydratase activase-related protein [Desulfoscipio gibsoniae]